MTGGIHNAATKDEHPAACNRPPTRDRTASEELILPIGPIRITITWCAELTGYPSDSEIIFGNRLRDRP